MSFDALTQWPRTYHEQVAWLNQFIDAGGDLQDLLAAGVTYTGTEYQKGRNLLIGADFKSNPWQRLNHDEIASTSISYSDLAGTSRFTYNSKMFYGPDRWYIYSPNYGSGDVTIERSADAPTVAQCGLSTESAKITATGGVTALRFGTAIDFTNFSRWIFNLSQLNFWVKCNKAVTLAFRLIATLDKGVNPYAYTQTFTISSANTWQNIAQEITDAAGSLATEWHSLDDAANFTEFPMQFEFILTTGGTGGTAGSWQSTNLGQPSSGMTVNGIENGGTDGEIYIALPQLENEDAATPFEFSTPFETLINCQRFYCEPEVSFPVISNVFVNYPLQMYDTPTRTLENTTDFTNPYAGSSDGTWLSCSSADSTRIYADADFYTTTD